MFSPLPVLEKNAGNTRHFMLYLNTYNAQIFMKKFSDVIRFINSFFEKKLF